METLGLVAGSADTVVTQNCGNLIVSIKDSRVTINREMASKILV